VLAAIVEALLLARLAAQHEVWRPERPRLRPLRRRRPAPLGDLARVEWTVAAALSSGEDVSRRLRPLVRDIAASRLLRSGIDLESEPERARELAGEELWGLLCAEPDDQPVGRRRAGIERARLRRIVERLEAL
jgi:hypothetical protein